MRAVHTKGGGVVVVVGSGGGGSGGGGGGSGTNKYAQELIRMDIKTNPHAQWEVIALEQ